MAELFANFAKSTLASGISAGATSLSVASGDGTKFPNPASPDYFTAFLLEGTKKEVVTVTARSSDTFTHSATVNSFTTAATVLTGVGKDALTRFEQTFARSALNVYLTGLAN